MSVVLPVTTEAVVASLSVAPIMDLTLISYREPTDSLEMRTWDNCESTDMDPVTPEK